MQQKAVTVSWQGAWKYTGISTFAEQCCKNDVLLRGNVFSFRGYTTHVTDYNYVKANN